MQVLNIVNPEMINFVILKLPICFVTPEDRHQGNDVEILAQRHQVYIEAKAKNPERWSGSTRNWSHISEVALNKGKPTKTAKKTKALLVT